MIQWNEMLSALAGSVIGGCFTLAGTWWGGHIQREQQASQTKSAEAAEVTGFLGAIEAELTVLWERYTMRLQPALAATPDGEIFNFQWPVQHDYFTVYTANAGMLGRVPDNGLRTLIVRAYTTAKGLVDSIRLNTQMIKQLEDLLTAPAGGTDRTADIGNLRVALIDYSRALKASEQELSALIGELLPKLRELQRETL